MLSWLKDTRMPWTPSSRRCAPMQRATSLASASVAPFDPRAFR